MKMPIAVAGQARPGKARLERQTGKSAKTSAVKECGRGVE